jgi:hypothetical protein
VNFTQTRDICAHFKPWQSQRFCQVVDLKRVFAGAVLGTDAAKG